MTQGLLLVLYIWEPRSDSVYSILGFMSLWGAVDAVWQSQVQGKDRQIVPISIFTNIVSISPPFVSLSDRVTLAISNIS